MLNAARFAEDLRIPSENKLEKLNGNLDGYSSIRIIDQLRIICGVQKTQLTTFESLTTNHNFKKGHT